MPASSLDARERVESFNQQHDLAYVSDDWEKLNLNLQTHEYGNEERGCTAETEWRDC